MAATATPMQHITTITPPSSSHSHDPAHGHPRSIWEYSVPLNHNEQAKQAARYAAHHSGGSKSPGVVRAHRQDSSRLRGLGTQSRSIENLSTTSALRTNERRAQLHELSNTSDADNLLDSYGSTSNHTSRSAPYGTASRGSRKNSAPSIAMTTRPPEDDADNWIHRDKLAQIESKELEAFRVERRASERQEPGSVSKRQRLASPVHIEVADEDDIESTYDPYREDAPSVLAKSFIPKPASNRAGGSRIPLPRGTVSSATTQSDQDASAHSTRSRNGSNGWTAGGAEQSPRSHSESQSSTSERQTHITSPSTSPKKGAVTTLGSQSNDSSTSTKARTPTKTNPTGLRKTTSNAQKQPSNTTKRAVSSGTKSPPESQRQITANGTAAAARPTTASQRPEGDPPWMASMYKPDPRLPPDQQLLPTHAKRLAQEQWEKEGKTGTVYDRDFKLLNSEPFPINARISTIIEPTAEQPAGSQRTQESTLNTRWPLSDVTPSLGSPPSQTSTRPGTSGTEHGNYKTVPSVNSPHATAVPMNSPAVQLHPIRVQEVDAKDERKKTGCCGACVVM